MAGDDETFLRRAIALGEHTALVEAAGGPFGAVIVRDGQILGEGADRVVAERDPTWHGEMAAIRAACRATGNIQLSGATLYTSAEPCPMCLAASHWAGIARIVYASTVTDARDFGDFDDSKIYDEFKKSPEDRTIPLTQALRDEAVKVWEKYKNKPVKFA